MPIVVERMDQVAPMFSVPRAIALVSVPWSPWPLRSRQMLNQLERSREDWLPSAPLAFFDLWPEREKALHAWYDELCEFCFPKFELHGHGYGPFWWLTDGEIVDCLTKPYEHTLEALQQRYVVLNREFVKPHSPNPGSTSQSN
jgi:hypothetical protein